MDSVVGEDPTLPVDFVFDASANLDNLPDVTTGPDITATNVNFDHLPDGTSPKSPVIHKVSSGQMSPIRAHTMKDYEQQISDLKKENFSLKLRIYFMEERLQPNFEENDDIKTNIELKVEVESLKKDLMDKQLLLVKASNAVESLVQEKEAITEKLKEENRKALEQLRERLQTETENSKKEVRELDEALKQLQKQLDDAQQQIPQEETDSLPNSNDQTAINDLEDALKRKNDEIAELKDKQDAFNHVQDELKHVTQQLDIVYRENENLKVDLDKEKEEKAILEPLQEEYLEQETRLKELETAYKIKDQQLEEKDKIIKELENELQKAKKRLEDLSGTIVSKEAALRSHEANSLKRDKAIQGLTEVIRNKDKEIKQLCDQIEEQETTLSDARESVHKAEKSKYESLEQYQSSMSDMETKLDETKASLHRKHLENERLQRAVARKSQELDKSRENKATTDARLDELVDQKDSTIKELKEELTDAKAQVDNRVGAVEVHYQGLLEDCQRQLQNKEQAIQRLTKGLEEKDKHVKEFMELARKIHRPTHEEKDGKELIIQSLRERLKQRDKAVEDAIEDQFQTAEMKDGEIRKLRVALRERDRELEKANSELLGAEDKINQLKDALEDKDAKNRQLRDSHKSQTKANKEAEMANQQSIKDKDATIDKLQNVLEDKDQTIEELRDAQGFTKGRDELIEQLSDRIKQKDKLMQEILAERDQMAVANEKETHDLLGTLREKDNQIRDLHDRYNKMMASKNEMLKELQKEVNEKEYEIQSAEDTLAQAEQEQAVLLNKMRNALADKDKTIEKLLTSGQEKDRLFWEMQQSVDQSPSHSPGHTGAEMMKVKAELAQVKKRLKEKEALVHDLSSLPQPEADDAQTLKDELENKNKLLAKAKDTIDALQRDHKADKQFRIDMSKLRRQNIELQSELQAKQDHIDALVHAGKVKENIIQELRLQDTNLPVRNGAVGGDSNNQLQQALIDHLAELSRLSDALKAERQLYVNITQSSRPGKQVHQSDPSHALDIELSAVQALRKQLEEGIKRNKEIRNNLLKLQDTTISKGSQGLSSKNPDEKNAEIEALKDQLEESRRWNASLQMRLDEMKQRADGVGSDVEPVIHTLRSEEEEASQQQDAEDLLTDVSKSAKELQKDVLHLQTQLLDEMRRRKSLENKLEKQEVDSLRSIPGQEEEMSSKKIPMSLQKQLDDLKTKLSQSEYERKILSQQLEAVMLNQTQPEPDGGPVVPILKQQLDQAKTLLMEKDRKLQEKEQQNQALRHHLGIGPSSPITPGRSMLAGLRQENARLQHELQDVKSHTQNLEHHIQSLQAKYTKAKQVEEALQQQLEKLAQSTPSDDEQFDKLAKELVSAKAQIQKYDEENRELRQLLGIGPDASIEDSHIVPDKLQQENAKLHLQLEEALKDIEDVQVQLDLANKELEEQSQVQVVDGKAEISRLQKQLRNADKLNELLKRHIELNSSSDGNQSFNPELIVDMAKEIEHLQEELDQSAEVKGEKVAEEGQMDGASQKTGCTKDRSTISAYKKKVRKVEEELDDTKQKIRTLQRRLQATEGTVHRQADKIKHYRREMHNAGIAPPGTPKRVHSDSNLLQSSMLIGRSRSTSNYSVFSMDSASSSTSLSPAPSEHGLAVSDMTFNEFGYTDDITELKEQIGILKNQLQRLRRAIRHLQRRLRATEGSRSPSPTRSINDSWFELTANQDAFDKMHLELDNLREELKQTNDANLTLQERNIELHHQLSAWSFDNRRQLDKESQTKMDIGRKSRDTNADKNDKYDQSKELNKEFKERKDLNRKLRDLLAENQKVAEETGKDLERLAKEVKEKNATISTLRKQLRQVLSKRSSRRTSKEQELIEHSTRKSQTVQTGDRSHTCKSDKEDVPDSAYQPQIMANHEHLSRTHHKCSTVQTDQLNNSTAIGEDNINRTEINNLKTKLRETERLSKTLKTELEIYRKVLDDWHSIPTESKQEKHQQDANEVLQEHLEEIRALRKRLEESINVNDRLREQLEAKLAGNEQSGVMGINNIHLYQTHIELSEENNSLKDQMVEKDDMIRQLKEEITNSRINLHRLTLENQQLKEQLQENVHLADSLRFELNVYEHLQQKRNKDNSAGTSPSIRLTDPSSGIDLTELLREIRHLRIQLERSIDTNNALRLRLEEMMNDRQGSRMSTIKVTTRSVEKQRNTAVKRSLFKDDAISHPRGRHSDYVDNSSAYSRVQGQRLHYSQDVDADFEQPEFYSIPSGTGSTIGIHIPAPSVNGDITSSKPNVVLLNEDGEELYAICTLATYKLISRCLYEGRVMGNLVETKLLESGRSSAAKDEHQGLSSKKCQELSKNVKYLTNHLEECSHHLSLFWKSNLPKNDELVAKLKKRLSAQEKLMGEALEKLCATNRMKEGMEQAIIDQLAMTHTVLRQARGNLEAQSSRPSPTSSD